MVDRTALLGAFEEYARALLSPYDVGEMLYRLTDQVVEVLDVDGAGVSIARDGRLAFLAATGSAVGTVEAHQERAGDGPCHDSFNHGTQVRIDDLTANQRWPEHRDIALETGFKALAAVPMPAEGRRIGALDLYSVESHEWTDDEVRCAQILANMATGYVLNNLKLSESRNLTERLQTALDTRIVVEQAAGVLCGRHDIDPPEAHDLLRNHARTFGVSMQDVCERVITGKLQL